MMGHGKRIDVDIDYEKQTFSVRDYGRGIPLGKVVDCVSMMNTGAKYNDDVFQFSVGLNGVGLKAVNALSEHFVVRAVRDGEYVEAIFSRGELVEKKKVHPRQKMERLFRLKPIMKYSKPLHLMRRLSSKN